MFDVDERRTSIAERDPASPPLRPVRTERARALAVAEIVLGIVTVVVIA